MRSPQPSNCCSTVGCRSHRSPQSCSSSTAARPISISAGSDQAGGCGRNQGVSTARSAGSARQLFSGRRLGIEPSGLPIHGEDTLVEVTPPVFGASVRRVEDPRLIRGAGRYVDDVQPAGCLHAVFLRSHLAHATIAGLNLDAARKAPGVVAAWSAADFEDLEPLEIEAPVHDRPLPERRVLAAGRTRYVGEAVAMLIAESRETAADALELIELELDPLPVVTDVERALAENTALLYPEFGANLAFAKESKHGQVKRAFDRAAVIVKERIVNQRLIPSALEPRGALAWLDNGRLTIEVSSQSAYGVREAIAASLGIDEDDVRVIVAEHAAGRLYERNADRPISGRRPSRSRLPDRADDGPSRWRARPGPGGGPAPQFRSPLRLPLHECRGQHVRQRQLPCQPATADRSRGLPGATSHAGDGAAAGTPAGHRHLDLRRGGRRICRGSGHGPARTRRNGHRDHRVNPPRPGSPDHLGPACRRGVRRSLRPGPRPLRRYGPTGLCRRYVRQPQRRHFGSGGS